MNWIITLIAFGQLLCLIAIVIFTINQCSLAKINIEFELEKFRYQQDRDVIEWVSKPGPTSKEREEIERIIKNAQEVNAAQFERRMRNLSQISFWNTIKGILKEFRRKQQ